MQVLELNGLLVSTVVPSEARLKYHFSVAWEDIDIKTLRDKLTQIVGRMNVEISRRKHVYHITIPVFEKPMSLLRSIRTFYFDMLRRHTIVIQSIEEIYGRRNIYLLPLERLEAFMNDWKKIEKEIKRINAMIQAELWLSNSPYNKLIQVFKELGLTRIAEDLEKRKEEKVWKLPEPWLRLQRFMFKYEEIEPYIKSEKIKEEIKRVLEDQYRKQLEMLIKSIAKQVEEILKPLAEQRTIDAINNAKKRINEIIVKTRSVGLHGVAEKLEKLKRELDVNTKIEELSAKMLRELELELE